MKVNELFESSKGGFTVLFTTRDADGRNIGGQLKVHGVVTPDQARNRAKAQLEKDYGDVKITRVTALKEEYSAPTKNPKLGFRNKGEKVPTGKQGIPIGGSKEWLKTFGATAEHVEQAMRVMKQSAAVKKLASLGLHDESSDRNLKNGSMQFIGTMAFPSTVGGTQPKVYRLKFTVQPNGKIDETQPNDFHRAPVTSPKPRIVPGDPVGSIVKSMTASMEKLASTMEARRAKEKKLLSKAK